MGKSKVNVLPFLMNGPKPKPSGKPKTKKGCK